MLRHDRALSLQNIPDFLRLLDGYRIQATLLAHLRRRPLPCSIGFPTGMSSTCVAEPPTDRN
ncbi:MAG: hypothetical protein WBZ25_11010 [Pseudolabrys sp.]